VAPGFSAKLLQSAARRALYCENGADIDNVASSGIIIRLRYAEP